MDGKCVITRQQYLNGECSHREYYAQFVNDSTKRRVYGAFGLCRIMSCSTERFREIPLDDWDCVVRNMVYDFRSLLAAGDDPTGAGLVCIAKEAAAQIRDDVGAGANEAAATSFGGVGES